MTDDDRSTGGDDAGREPVAGSDIADQLVGRIAEHDRSAADDVQRIIERGAELHELVSQLESKLDDREERIEELEATVEEYERGSGGGPEDAGTDGADGASEGGEGTTELEEQVETLESDLEEREDRIDQLESDLEEREARVEELEADLDDREERIDHLKTELDDREEEVEDLSDRLKRKQADFQNYKKRAERRREELKERATEDLVERLLDVRDNLRRAVENDHPDVESLREGVEMTIREFDRVLGEENVEEIVPSPGQEVDPQCHEVMMQVDSPDHPEDTIAEVYAPGYRIADRVIRPAQVTVSTGATGDDETDSETQAAPADGDTDDE